MKHMGERMGEKTRRNGEERLQGEEIRKGR